MSNSHPFARQVARVFLSPSGRIGRLSLLMYGGFALLTWAVLLVFLVEAIPDIVLPAMSLWIYVFVVLSVKRLHDLNYSGWHLLWGIIPLIYLVILIGLLFVPGPNGKNKFGEPEKPLFHNFDKKSAFARNLDKPFGRVILTILVIALLAVFGHYSSLDDAIVSKSNELLMSIEGGGEVSGDEYEVLAEDSYSDENKLELYKNAGYMYSGDGDDASAKVSFEKALALLNEGTFDYYLVSAEIAMTEDKARAALFNYEKAYEMSPSDFQVNNGLGLFYLGLSPVSEQFTDYQKALDYFKIAYKQNPYITTKENMAIAHFFLEDYDEALSLFLEVNVTSKKPYIDYWLGLCYLMKDDFSLAQEYLKNAYDAGIEIEQVYVDFINTDL